MSCRTRTSAALLFAVLWSASVDGGTSFDEVTAAIARAEATLAEQRPIAVIEELEPLVADHATRIAPVLLRAYRAAERNEAGRALIEKLDLGAEGSPTLVIAVAQWEAEEGWVRRAEERLSAALAVSAEESRLHLARSRLRASMGELDGAWEDLERGIALGADPASLAWHRGTLALDRGDEARGRQWLRELLARSPGHLGARLAMARADRRSAEPTARTAAIEGYWSILERDPHHAAALGELGSLLVRAAESRKMGTALLERFREIRDRRERIDRLRREIREGRDAFSLRLELAQLLREDRDPRAARPVLIPVESFPKELQGAAYAELGAISRAIGDARGALSAYGAALLRDPTRDRLRLEIAEILLELGDARRALKTLERGGDRLDPRRATWVRIESQARAGLGWKELGPQLWSYWRDEPTDAVAARAFVDAAIGLGEEAAAAKQVEAVLAATSEEGDARATLLWARAEFRRGTPLTSEASVKLESELLDGAPHSIEAHLWVADRCTKRRDHARAEELRREARRLRAWRGPETTMRAGSQ